MVQNDFTPLWIVVGVVTYGVVDLVLEIVKEFRPDKEADTYSNIQELKIAKKEFCCDPNSTCVVEPTRPDKAAGSPSNIQKLENWIS